MEKPQSPHGVWRRHRWWARAGAVAAALAVLLVASYSYTLGFTRGLTSSSSSLSAGTLLLPLSLSRPCLQPHSSPLGRVASSAAAATLARGSAEDATAHSPQHQMEETRRALSGLSAQWAGAPAATASTTAPLLQRLVLRSERGDGAPGVEPPHDAAAVEMLQHQLNEAQRQRDEATALLHAQQAALSEALSRLARAEARAAASPSDAGGNGNVKTARGTTPGAGTDRHSRAAHAAQAASTRSLSSSGLPLTQRRCHRMAAWGDVCTYEDVCFDGKHWYFLEEDGAPSAAEATSFHAVKDLLCGYAMPQKGPVPSTDGAYFPFNAGTSMYGVRLKPEAIAAGRGINVSWVEDRTLWHMALSEPIDNIWFFASRIVPVFLAVTRNASGTLPFPLHRFGPGDVMFTSYNREYFDRDWHNSMRRVALGFDVDSQYVNDPWWKELSPSNVRCFKRVIATGVFPYVVPDIQTGFELRERIFSQLQLTLPAAPSNRVLLWLRPPKFPRAIINIDAMIALIESYGLSYTLVYGAAYYDELGAFQREIPFKDQVELFSSHGILVTPHGAGLTNLVMMTPLSAMIEVFPYQLDHTVYSTLAGNMGVGSFPVHGTNGSFLWRNGEEYMSNKCDELSPLAINVVHYCRPDVLNYSIEVNMEAFEFALVNAVQRTGHRLRYRGAKPVPVKDTPTGWT